MRPWGEGDPVGPVYGCPYCDVLLVFDEADEGRARARLPARVGCYTQRCPECGEEFDVGYEWRPDFWIEWGA